jgi:hypothetical protein
MWLAHKMTFLKSYSVYLGGGFGLDGRTSLIVWDNVLIKYNVIQ